MCVQGRPHREHDPVNQARRRSWKIILDRGRTLWIPRLEIHLVGWGAWSSPGSPNGIITVLSTQQVPHEDVLKGDFSNCHFQKVPVADATIRAV